ncbi:unnamed protein product [Dovyalis caffra]|uniref:Uncharacterized protein n=1 Tax=Dovyalis caffra TaxID=77055 RepID=A0AAV1RPV7_9ROSI|nr:unnamed protein product [Dovyalis caffra]
MTKNYSLKPSGQISQYLRRPCRDLEGSSDLVIRIERVSKQKELRFKSGRHGSAPAVDSVTEQYFQDHPFISVYASVKRQTNAIKSSTPHSLLDIISTSSAKQILLLFLSFHLLIKTTSHNVFTNHELFNK